MKHNGLLIRSILCLATLNLAHNPGAFSKTPEKLMGLIESPDSDSVPQFALHFAGKQEFNKSDGFFTFQLDWEMRKYSLLICEKCTPCFAQKENASSSSTIAGFTLDKEKPYKYFELDYDKETAQLVWQEKPLARRHFDNATQSLIETSSDGDSDDALSPSMIPADAIVVLMDPAIVARVETWGLAATKQYLQGPKIILKSKTKKEIQQSSRQSLTQALDLGRFFEPTQRMYAWKASDKQVSINC